MIFRIRTVDIISSIFSLHTICTNFGSVSVHIYIIYALTEALVHIDRIKGAYIDKFFFNLS